MLVICRHARGLNKPGEPKTSSRSLPKERPTSVKGRRRGIRICGIINCGTELPALLGGKSWYASMCCCVMMAFSIELSRSMADEELEQFRGDDIKDNDDSGRDNPNKGGVFGTENSAVVPLVELATGDEGTGDGVTFLCVAGSHLRTDRPRGILLPVSNSRSISASVTRKQLLVSRHWLVAAESV